MIKKKATRFLVNRNKDFVHVTIIKTTEYSQGLLTFIWSILTVKPGCS